LFFSAHIFGGMGVAKYGMSETEHKGGLARYQFGELLIADSAVFLQRPKQPLPVRFARYAPSCLFQD
jgi:hypothetical protein